jgi:CheY-like chemotaxis protein
MRKARVLFVDDEKRVLNSMRGLFRRDFELFLTTEGQDAIDITQQNEIDVIVADQRMPGMNGVQVLEQVKQKSPGTIRILLTGYADLDAIEGSINVGEVFRFLSKPCPPKLLRETLRLAIDAAQATAAAAQAPARVTPTAAPPQPAPSRPASPPQASPPQAGPLDAANDATQPTVASRPAPQAVSSSAPPPVERRQSNPPDIFTEPPAPQPASAEYDEEYDSTADTQQNLALPESALTTIPTGIEDTQRNPVLTHPASAPRSTDSILAAAFIRKPPRSASPCSRPMPRLPRKRCERSRRGAIPSSPPRS